MNLNTVGLTELEWMDSFYLNHPLRRDRTGSGWRFDVLEIWEKRFIVSVPPAVQES